MKDLHKQFYNQHSTARSVALSSETKQRIKFSLMAKIKNIPQETKSSMSANKGFLFYLKNSKPLLLNGYVIVPLVLLLLIGGGGTVALADSLPGEPLYPIKRSVETITVMVTPSEDKKNDLKIKYAQRRITELESLEQRGAVAQEVPEAIVEDGKQDSENKTDQAREKSDSEQKSTTDTQSKINKIRKYKRISPEVQKQIREEVKNARKFIDEKKRSNNDRGREKSEDETKNTNR